VSTFEQTIVAAGLRPRVVVADGRIRRCPTESKPARRNGWYVLHPDGHGAWGDWTTGTGTALGKWTDDQAATNAVPADVFHRIAAQRARERQARIDAMRAARRFWDDCHPVRSLHPYLARKGLGAAGVTGLRQSGAKLVVPVVLDRWVISVQTITPEGEKKFHTGAPVKAGAYVIDRPRAAVTCFVEGLATGLAVYQSVRQARVVVCFDAGNLMPAAQRLAPTGSVVIAADNDHATQARRGMNPGLEKAHALAEHLGCGVAYPKGLEGSDWCDALKEWGENAGRRVEREILAAARYVTGPP
jgi:putative DNA primase/helicase